MQQLNDAQIKVIQGMYEDDPEFRKLVQSKVKERIEKAREEAKALQGLFSSQPASKSKPAKKSSSKGNKKNHVAAGTKNHRPAIMEAVKAKPGMLISELRESLKARKHEIGDKTLNTLVHVMRKEFIETKGEKGLRSEGEKPTTRLYTK